MVLLSANIKHFINTKLCVDISTRNWYNYNCLGDNIMSMEVTNEGK